MKIETWKDSADTYAQMTTDESIYMVSKDYPNVLTMYLKADSDEDDYMPENMVFSLSRGKLTDMGRKIHDILVAEMYKESGDAYLLRDSQDNKAYDVIYCDGVSWEHLQNMILDTVKQYGEDPNYDGSDCIYDYVVWMLVHLPGVTLTDIRFDWQNHLPSVIF